MTENTIPGMANGPWRKASYSYGNGACVEVAVAEVRHG